MGIARERAAQIEEARLQALRGKQLREERREERRQAQDQQRLWLKILLAGASANAPEVL